MGESIFDLYPKTLKTEGKNSVYHQAQQIAQIDVPAEIIDDLHHYKIYAIDSESARVAALFCAYMYVIAGFRPGQKIRKGRYKRAAVSFDKTFDDKYNPGFVRQIEP